MPDREVLVRVLAPRVRILGRHPWIPPALSGVVDDRHDWEVAHRPPGPLYPQAQVRLLALQEEPLIHYARAEQRFPSREP